jgi:ABC-type glycerol-3-phosphate transport system substrate-binding protein
VSYGENWQEAIQYAVDFTNEHCGGYETGQEFQAFALAGSSDQATVWLSKKQNMTLDGPWEFSYIATAGLPTEQWDIFPLPYGPSFDPDVPLCGQTYTWTWAMFAGGKHPEETWLLMKWLSAEKGNIDFTKGMLRPAALYEAARDPFWAENMPHWDSWLKVLESVPKTKPPTSGITPAVSATEMERLEIEAMERVLRGDWTVAEAAEFMQENAQALYDEWWAEQG